MSTAAAYKRLEREATYHRAQAAAARDRGDGAEADLWDAMADDIDDYLQPPTCEHVGPDLFGVPDG